MRIDSHQHFWKYNPAEYPWITPGSAIQRDFLPADLAPELAAHKLDGCVAVQARQTAGETRWLLELAERASIIKAVVGWVDLRSPKLEEQLAELSQHEKLAGVRHVVQEEPDDRFMLREDFRRGIGLLHPFGLTYDLLVYPKQLPAAIEVVREFPEQAFVLDHLAKPLIKDGTLSPWREQIRELAASPNVFCKVSGMVTEARWHAWNPADFRPYLDAAFEAFGPDRLMYGSDWPVALLSASYAELFAIVRDYVATLGSDVEAKFFGQNATRFYHLK
jgi:L-fuconolactonase